MAVLGEWRGGTTSLLPSTTWAAPNTLFSGTATRNDGSAYGFTATTSTLTLPSSGLADGYLIVGAFEFEDDSNGRHNPQSRLVQASGTGDFVSGASSGYNRDNSEDRAYVRTWAFVNNPAASATFQFQWRRDSDTPTGGTVRSQLQVIPLFYSNYGIYSSASTACPGGTTPNQVTGFSAVAESDTAAIELATNVVTLKSDNKRYLCLGSSYWQGIGSSRTQRWHGFRVDGAIDDTAKGYSYGRNSSNADIGEMFTTVIERATTDITLDQFVYRGPAVGTFPNAGADVDGNTTGSSPNHVTVVLELNDSAEVFQSNSTTQQDIDVAGTRVDLQIADSLNVNDSASFTSPSSTVINLETTADVLLGANVSGGYASSSTARYTGYAEFTIGGTGETYSFAGDFSRGDQSTQDCWGWSANLMSFVAGTSGDDLGVDAGKITGGEGGTVDTISGWVGFWGINLDTLEAGAANTDVPLNAGSFSLTGQIANATLNTDVSLAAGSYAWTGQAANFNTPAALDTGSFTWSGFGGFTESYIPLAADSFSLTGQDATVATVADTSVPLDAGSFTLSGLVATVTTGRPVSLDAGSYTLTGYSVATDTGAAFGAGSYILTGLDATVLQTSLVALDAGTFALTGNAATLDVGAALTAGAYTLTGNTLTINITGTTAVPLDAGGFVWTGLSGNTYHYIPLASESFEVTGQTLDVVTATDTSVSLDAGAFTWVGQALTADLQISLAAETFTWSGNTLKVQISDTISLAPGSYSFTGQSLAINTAGVTTVPLDAGEFIWTGVSGNTSHYIPLLTDSFLLTGQDVGIDTTANTVVPLDENSFVWGGQPLTAEFSTPLVAGNFAWTGSDSLIEILTVLDSDTFSLTGQSLEILIPSDTVISVDAGSYTWAGLTSVIDLTPALNAGAFSWTGYGANIARDFMTEAGSYSLTGFATNLATNHPLQSGVFAFSGHGLDALTVELNLNSAEFTFSGFGLGVVLSTDGSRRIAIPADSRGDGTLGINQRDGAINNSQRRGALNSENRGGNLVASRRNGTLER